MLSNEGLLKYIDKLEFTVIDTALLYVTQINKIIIDDSLLIVHVGKERKEIVVMNKSGQLYGRIDYLGGGPGEYKTITDITYNFKSKEIIVYDIVTKCLLSYNLRGKFLWQKKLDISAVNLITDDQYYYFYTKKLISELGNGNEVIVTDQNCKKVNAYFKYTVQPDRFRFSSDQVFSRNAKGEVYFSNVFRDTTYLVSSKNCVPFLTYIIDNEMPQPYTVDRVPFNQYFKDYVYHEGLFEATKNCLFFNVVRKGRYIQYYLATDRSFFIGTASSRISKNLFLSKPMGNDNQYFYYSLRLSGLEGQKDELYSILKKYGRTDLIPYFDKYLLSYNPIIVRVKFFDKLPSINSVQ